MIRPFIVFALLLGLAFSSKAQLQLQLHTASSDSGQQVLNDLQPKTTFDNPADREAEVQRVLRELRSAGHLAASIDSTSGDSVSQTVHLFVGQSFHWGVLDAGNVDEHILSKSGFRERLYIDKPLSVRAINRLFEKLITWCEENGYPFASVQFKDASWKDGTFSAKLDLQKNQLVRIDSLQVIGEVKTSETYLTHYLGIKRNSLYRESSLRQITNRIGEIPFLTEKQQHQIYFTEDHSKLILFLEQRKANGFNGILGLLPDEETGRVTITGDVQLKLQNALNQGEVLELNWRRLPSQTQDLKVDLLYPFIFNSPFGLDANLKLYRRDTLFSDQYYDIGFQYQLYGGNFLKAFFSQQTSNLLATSQYEDLQNLPPFIDVSTTSYGLGFRTQRLDYVLNPREGFRLEGTGRTGTRKIKENGRLDEILYDSLDLSTVRFEVQLSGDYFLPVGKRSTIRTGFQGGWTQADNLFQNELYRIGGIKTLRGFDEESIFASTYTIGTLEFRYLMEQNSYLYAFFDGAFYEDLSNGDNERDTPFGFGVGTSFQTKAGIFSINYALGREQNNPIRFAAAKVHFGFVNFF